MSHPNTDKRWVEHRALVELLWAEGKTAREIAVVVGWKTKNPESLISQARARGYDLPYRRTDEQLARIAVGSAKGLAAIRRARRKKRAA